MLFIRLPLILVIFLASKMSIVLDGTSINFTASGATSATSGTFSNTLSGSVIIVCVGAEDGGTKVSMAVSSVSDNSGQGLTWTKLCADNRLIMNMGFGQQGYVGMEAWYAFPTSPWTNKTVTINYVNTFDDVAGVVFAVNGGGPTPFDTNVSLPAFNFADAASASTIQNTGVSTTSTSGIIFNFAGGAIGTGSGTWTTPPTVNSGWTRLNGQDNTGGSLEMSLYVAYQAFSTAFASATISPWTPTAPEWQAFSFAVVPPSGGGGGSLAPPVNPPNPGWCDNFF